MRICVSLARAETGSGALEWFKVPIVELAPWVEVLGELNKNQRTK